MIKRLILGVVAMMAMLPALAADTYTVTVAYDGTTATISIPSEVSSYVSCTSGTSSHVKLVQTSTTEKNPGEIIYQLSGTSSDGEFFMEGEFKATILLNGLTLTNPDSTAIHIKDGKRIKVSLANGTTNTLKDGTKDAESKGCFHCKGHTEFVGKGTLNVSSNIRHAIYSKEYVTVKNCTINVTGAKKDAIHCQQYFLMQSGSVNISSADDDGIEVEYKDSTNPTGTTANHENEDSGNFYMTGGTLTISTVGEKCIKADGSISLTGGTTDFDTSNIQENALSGIHQLQVDEAEDGTIYDLQGRQVPKGSMKKGIYIVKGKKIVLSH